ncbi:Nop52-domain-containing protein [Schizopora paradoxa]|uniref:Nop52-domain-containing protein n=1 Tax=Schizopora paradoxa TaxID=27342 RepID=A0A0H2S842_9AGAM|nr:Nop52-domain-containing protein [Schizopora paradoxa]
MADDSSSQPPLAKYLASSDKKTRDKAVKSLAKYLSENQGKALPKQEMAKLWKGIFYCYWMSDKPLVQQALSSELADLLLLISSTESAFAFLGGFWEAIVREWNGIDRLRMDKYYMLVRKFINASFRLLRRAEWENSALGTFNEVLTSPGGPLCPDDTRIPGSLTYHIVDIYLEELEKALSVASDPSSDTTFSELPAPLIPLLLPFFDLAARTSSSITHSRVSTGLIDPLLVALTTASSSDPPSKKRKFLTLSQQSDLSDLISKSCIDEPQKGVVQPAELRNAVLRSMFDVASGPDVKEANRRKLYAIWKVAKAEEEDIGDTS